MKKKVIKNYKIIIYLLLAASFLGLFLLRKKRQKISPLTQRNIPYANVKLEVVPPEIEICLDREKELILTIDPVADNAEGPVSFAAAELSFSFNPKKAEISSINFHQEYAGSLWNKEATNQSGLLKITILSLSQNLPQEKFELAKIVFRGEKSGESELALEKDISRLMGVRGSTDPNLSHDLNLNRPETVKTLIKVAKCEG